MKKLLATALLAVVAVGDGLAGELSVAGTFGIHWPAQSAFRDVYGTPAAFGLDVRWLLNPNLGFSAGVMSLNKQGTAVSLDGGPDALGVNLRLTTFPLTAYLHIPRGRFGLDLGAGLAFHDFKETWKEEGGPVSEGRKWGLLASASAAYEVTGRLSLVGTIRYLDVPTGQPSRLTDKVNLGGLQVLVGASWKILR